MPDQPAGIAIQPSAGRNPENLHIKYLAKKLYHPSLDGRGSGRVITLLPLTLPSPTRGEGMLIK
jgi:hypothetical protein